MVVDLFIYTGECFLSLFYKIKKTAGYPAVWFQLFLSSLACNIIR
jgi:hypothetical protein